MKSADLSAAALFALVICACVASPATAANEEAPVDLQALNQEAPVDLQALNQETIELYRTGRYERGVVVAKRALDLAEMRFGPNHPEVAENLNNLAVFYRALGQYAQAEPLYKRALEIDREALGPDHPSVAANMNNLRCFTAARACMCWRNRSTRMRWPSTRRRLGQIIPMWPTV